MTKPALAAPICVGPILTPALHRREARKLLLDSGWTYLDGGSFSSVWKSPCETRVVKITKPDLGSDATTAAAIACPDNPHMVRIYGTLRLSCGGSVTEVEVLEAAGYDEYHEVRRRHDLYLKGQHPGGLLDDAFLALEVARDDHGGTWAIGYDLHQGNVMIRRLENGGFNLILTDLLYDFQTLRAGHGHGGTKHDPASVRAASVEALA